MTGHEDMCHGDLTAPCYHSANGIQATVKIFLNFKRSHSHDVAGPPVETPEANFYF